MQTASAGPSDELQESCNQDTSLMLVFNAVCEYKLKEIYDNGQYVRKQSSSVNSVRVKKSYESYYLQLMVYIFAHESSKLSFR